LNSFWQSCKNVPNFFTWKLFFGIILIFRASGLCICQFGNGFLAGNTIFIIIIDFVLLKLLLICCGNIVSHAHMKSGIQSGVQYTSTVDKSPGV